MQATTVTTLKILVYSTVRFSKKYKFPLKQLSFIRLNTAKGFTQPLIVWWVENDVFQVVDSSQDPRQMLGHTGVHSRISFDSTLVAVGHHPYHEVVALSSWRALRGSVYHQGPTRVPL